MNLEAINQQQQQGTATAARQTFDMSRLKLLNANAKEDKLSKEEASAVVRYTNRYTKPLTKLSHFATVCMHHFCCTVWLYV
jgi:hypothetical protein